ncbi:MAG: type II toxin-antitoxin system PrlF family antitoxin [Thiothrix sp.]|uniref:type II toxin-antitoxin system PrlF family antitoxin n=1 Tax=Thiothrix sp. TaxID=1032 RepID=UPI002630EA13|nr:type II toxin-antitoxin system PrlF family antitoxin [Thiothrix sp.]MDD5392070.1 type II toxin-antitoxin system PrlF family antitoxin [Thiothrix sp.]
MPISVFEAESTLTDRYQTTVPEPVRRALRLGKRDKIHYTIQADGSVVLTRVKEDEKAEDPALGSFLQFLEKDITQRPQGLVPVTQAMLDELNELLAGVEIGDINAPLEDDEDDDA